MSGALRVSISSGDFSTRISCRIEDRQLSSAVRGACGSSHASK
jgi:hypothetical protein